MPGREDAGAYLAQQKREDWRERRRQAVDSLANPLRSIGRQLLGYEASGKLNLSNHPLFHKYPGLEGAQALETLTAAERQAVLRAIWPAIWAEVDAAWELQKRLPYAMYGGRRAFRAPDRPAITLERRVAWLNSLLAVTGGYEEDVAWLAQWAGYLQDWSGALGPLLAAAIQRKEKAGEAVFEILAATLRGEHEVGMVGRHVIQALLIASRTEGWALVEQTLLAAQRQEGLRQVILETVDEAHPEAFRRMVRLIREHNLIRFSSVVRAVDVWLGLAWDAASASAVRTVVEQLDRLLWEDIGCDAALRSGDPTLVYLALCTLAFADVDAALEAAAPLLRHPAVEHRFVAAYFLAQVQLRESQAALLPALQDEDLRVAAVALRGANAPAYLSDAQSPPALFERLEAALPRFPARARQLEPLVWPWLGHQIGRREVVQQMINALGKRPVLRLMPYFDLLGPGGRSRVVRLLAERQDEWNDETRELMIRFLGDRSLLVREHALQALTQMQLTPADAAEMESYLTRKSGDLRRGVITLLLGMEDQAVLTSAGQLLGATSSLQRQAALEMLRQMKQQGRSAAACRRLLETHATGSERLPPAEKNLLSSLLREDEARQTVQDGLGLYEPAKRTAPHQPNCQFGRLRRNPFVSEAALRLIKGLDNYIHDHRETPVKLQAFGDREQLLGNITYGFPIFSFRSTGPGLESAAARVPLRELWQQWWQERPSEQRDNDGLELLRALAAFTPGWGAWHPGLRKDVPGWVKGIRKQMFVDVEEVGLRYRLLVYSILFWQLLQRSPTGAAELLLDGVEHTLALADPQKFLSRDEQQRILDWRHAGSWLRWLVLARQHRDLHSREWQAEHHLRLWGLLRWLDEPQPGLPRFRPSLDEVMRAFQAGGATEADILDQLIGPREDSSFYAFGGGFRDLYLVSSLRPDPGQSQFATDPALREMVSRCRARIVDIECRRGDLTTAASGPALALRYSGGAHALVRLLKALGRQSFLRGWSYDSRSKKAVLSHLIRATSPGPEDSVQELARQVAAAGIEEKRLVETAMYAPQWAEHIEAVVGWPALAEAVWWFHAHTKDNNWQVDQSIRAQWQAEVGERTPLTSQRLVDGAVDVAWFHRAYGIIGESRWQALDRAAKYASSSGGHKRAQLFARTMSHSLEEGALLERIRKKRHQDSVRALGLLPLPQGAEGEKVLLDRYLVLQEFVHGSRKFGAQRRASEALAAQIGLENLARTAGYPDPPHLQWTMEARTAPELARGPVSATAGEVQVTLSVDTVGEAQIRVEKKGRRLKSVPGRIKKEAEIARLLELRNELLQQGARARRSLEQAMCRGAHFSRDQLRQLMAHPVLCPMLEQVVLVAQGDGTPDAVMGYLVQRGQALEDVDGHTTTLSDTAALRIAHPYDLWQSGEWHRWQQECFRRERIQPFKQVFRELYPLTATERAEGTFSRRYEGHQVNPKQALALLDNRGWIVHPQEGVRRAFHDEGLSAWLSVTGSTYTPAEVEDMALERVSFTHRGAWQPLPLVEIPPRLFSEVMRDLDLVVSVAHTGGVDPEATASTIEMRASVLRETLALLAIENVRLSGQHALVTGRLNNYSVHLGSGVAHQQPGGALCIVPVHGQHRGRLFLPFADDDPKTAEVLAKVLLLAQDDQIKDPTILEQITRVG